MRAGARRKRRKALSPVRLNGGVPYHTAESMAPPAAPTNTGALQVPKCHICQTNRDSEWQLSVSKHMPVLPSKVLQRQGRKKKNNRHFG